MLVNVRLSHIQPTTSVTTLAKAASRGTSVTSSSSGSSAALAFVKPQQDKLRMRLPTKATEKGFFKSIQTTLAAGLGSLASDFDAATTVQPENQSVNQNTSSEIRVNSLSVSDQTIDTAVALLNIGAQHSTSSEVQVTDPTINSPYPLSKSSRGFEVAANLEDTVIVCTCGHQTTSLSLLCPVYDDPLKWSASTQRSKLKCTCPNSEKPNTRFGGKPQGKFSKSTHQYTKFK